MNRWPFHPLALASLLLVCVLGCKRETPTSPPDSPSPPATAPTAQATPIADTRTRPPLHDFLDLVRALHPDFPTTQPLAQPAKYAESACIVLDLPVFLDNRRDLWITHPDAPPLLDTLASAADQQVHIVPVPIVYIRWRLDAADNWTPTVITPTADGSYQAITVTREGIGRRRRLVERRQPLPPRQYLWHRAFDWQDGIAVPTPTGASLLHLADDIREAHFDFATAGLLPSAATTTAPATTRPTLPDGSNGAITQIVPDTRGLLAFIPWDVAPGATRVVRFVDNQWSILAPETEDEKVVHLIPLLDGSLLRLVRGDTPDTVKLRLSLLETVDVPEQQILALVDQLTAPLPDQREAAFVALQQYGQGIWPLLERIADQQPLEARLRIRQLLRNRIAPTLGGMTIIADRLDVLSRQPDGTVLLFAPQGVTMPAAHDQVFTITPAWIVTGPGTGIQLLPQRMTHELRPGQTHLQWVSSDWIAADPARGIRMWIGNEFLPLLSKQHADFRHVMGVDRALRWLFATRPIATAQLQPGEKLLILDRHLPDPTPRLPVWIWDDPNAAMGWDDNGYPGMKSGGAFVLDESEWRNLNLAEEPFHTDPADARPHPITLPAPHPDLGQPLAVAPDGTAYFGGRDELVALAPSGAITRWPLPARAVGQANPHLAVAPDGRLFLFNQRGRLLRIAPTPGRAEPFKLEAVFTRNIPNTPEPLRLWVDPAGRLCFMASPNRMAICFPIGRVPRPISLLMPADAEEEW